MPYLVVKWRGEEVHRAELTGPLIIGREMGVGLWINDPALSRKHCRIEPAGVDQWRVVDLHSRNGVYVKDDRIAIRMLDDGDRFRIGDAKVTFHAGEFQSRRAATPEEALFASHMQPTRKLTPTHPAPALAAKTTLVAERPIMPSRVSFSAALGKPLVQPFGLAFKRSPAKPQFKGSLVLEPSASPPSGSRGWLSSWLSSVYARLSSKRDVA